MSQITNKEIIPQRSITNNKNIRDYDNRDISNISKNCKYKRILLQNENIIDKKEYLMKPFPLLTKITNKRLTNNSKFFLKTLVDNDFKSFNKSVNTSELLRHFSLNSPHNSFIPKIINESKRIHNKNTSNNFDNLTNGSGIYVREKSNKQSFFVEKKKIMVMKKNPNNFKSLVDDKFFLNKLSSFYGIRERKITSNEKIKENNNFFSLTNSNILDIFPVSKKKTNQLLTTNSNHQSVEFQQDSKSRNKQNYKTLSITSHMTSLNKTATTLKIKNLRNLHLSNQEELKSIKFKVKGKINLSIK